MPAERPTVEEDPPESEETILQEVSELLSKLRNNEMKWRDRHEMLEKEGYILRPRLRPGWTPSWLQSGKSPLRCEDGEPLPLRSKLVDATHKESGKLVYIKEVKTDSEEHRIAQLLTKEEWVVDPRNHCVPIVKIFKDHEDPLVSYIVMPFLRPVDDPPFESVKEIVEFVDQILEGLVFLHEKGIAHRDCVMYNILMDADAMYPEGFHPIALNARPDYTDLADYKSRTSAGAKYYYVDFGISVYIPEELESKLVTGIFGRDQDPPELSDIVPYDPFKLDIFIIGNMLKQEFYDKFCNLEFLAKLLEAMTKPTPDHRPDAEEALAMWKSIRDTVWTINMEWRPRPRQEHPIGSVVFDAISLHRVFMFFAKSLAGRVPL